ncbi:MAG: hypothetical protein WCE49_15290 [Terrimicrobiaceae bacterium]
MAGALTMFPFSSEEVQKHFVSAEELMRACDQVWSVDRRSPIKLERGQPRAGSCLYCKVDHLIGLFDQLRLVRNRVVLVSSESDRPITREFLERCPPQVAHWFSTNVQARDERLSALPLGLANSYCDITLKAPLIAAHSRLFAERSHWLYVNFRTTSNPAVRESAMHYFRSLGEPDWVTVQEAGRDFEGFLGEMTMHRFALCPPGNGIDTHRLWEALYSRTIPVALAHPAMDGFRDLPILFVEDFRQLTRDFLAREYERITSSRWTWQKLFVPWWRDRIRDQQEKLKDENAMLPRSEFLREIARTRLAALKRRVLRKS